MSNRQIKSFVFKKESLLKIAQPSFFFFIESELSGEENHQRVVDFVMFTCLLSGKGRQQTDLIING